MSDGFGLPAALQKLIREFSKLPSVGVKSATRLAYHLVQNDRQAIDELVQALREAKEKIRLCEECLFISEAPRCYICNNANRDRSIICIVEKPVDVLAIERAGGFRGLYHVLHGLWAPLRGLGPESIRLPELIKRLEEQSITEVILALNATVEGDATALYVARELSERGIATSRLAQGLPKGGELEYADEATLSQAFDGRKTVNL